MPLSTPSRRLLATTVLVGAAMASPLMAQTGSMLQFSANGEYRYERYVDLAAAPGLGHAPVPDFIPDVEGAGATRYVPVVLDNSNFSSSWCFDISTTHPDFVPNETADTRIWVDMEDGTFRGLNDDFGGSLFSHGRVFLKGGGPGVAARVTLLLSVFDEGWNDAHFAVFVSRQNLTQAQCTTDQAAIPYVVVTATAQGTIKTFSPNAN